MRWTLTAIVVVALSATATAEEVLLGGGEGINGTVEKVDETGVTIKTDTETLHVPTQQLDPIDHYNRWSKKVADTAEARLRLAVFAYENGLFNQARGQYRKAAKLDPEVVKDFEKNVIPEIKEGIARRLLDLAGQAYDDGKIHVAERIAGKLLTQLEDTVAAAEARQVIAEVHFSQKMDDRQKLLKRLSKYLPKDEAKAVKERERLTKKLTPIERKIERARDSASKGLRTKSASRKKSVFERAAKQLESAVKDLEKLEAAAQDEPALLDQIQGLKEIAKREAVEAWVHAGNVYIQRGSHKGASDAARNARRVDRKSKHARRFERRAREASQTNSRWGTFARGGGTFLRGG